MPEHRFQTVEAYLSAQPQPLCDVGLSVARVIDGALPDADATLWHGHPTWKLGGEPICLLKAYTRHVTFALWRGPELDDPSDRLKPSDGQTMASVKLRAVEDVDATLFAGWLAQRRALSG